MIEDMNSTLPCEDSDGDVCEERFNEDSNGDSDDTTCQKFDLGLEKENLELRNEVNELKDKILRFSAEYDNYRKRTLKEKNESYSSGMIDVIFSVLPVLDNLERAESVEGDIESLKKGVSMVISLFRDVLNKFNVDEIDTSSNFDPNLHEAVSHVSDENLDKNVIVEVLQKGYRIGDKVIRYSMVKVAN